MELESRSKVVIFFAMSPKAQHEKRYKKIPIFLKKLRESAGLTQRQIGSKLGRPQSWVYNCETNNRRVDIGEFLDWVEACGFDPLEILKQLIEER